MSSDGGETCLTVLGLRDGCGETNGYNVGTVPQVQFVFSSTLIDLEPCLPVIIMQHRLFLLLVSYSSNY